MVKTWTAKDPDERLDYVYDWTPDLNPGETLASYTFTPVNLAGLTIADEVLRQSDFVVWFTGGTDGETAQFTLRVTTTDNRIFEDSIVLPIVSSTAPVPYPGGQVDPTPANLVATFPEFATVPVGQMQYYLDRAAQSVDTSWGAPDFGHARMLLAAHFLTLAGLGSSADAAAVRSGADQFRSMSIASLSLTRFDKGKTGSLASTRYGAEFMTLRQQWRAGPRVTGGVTRGWGDGDYYPTWGF
jgi:hypothetical protein